MAFTDDINAFMQDFATTLQTPNGVSFSGIFEQESSDVALGSEHAILTKTYYIVDPQFKQYVAMNMVLTDLTTNTQWRVIDYEMEFMEQLLFVYVSSVLGAE